MGMTGFLKRIYGPGAVLVFAGAWWGLLQDCPFLKTWFYLFAWWSYILFADWLNLKLRGESRLTSSPRGFAALCATSVFFWLIFEWFNLFLKNWSYLNVPSSIFLRWLGYALAFATVLPGIFETYDLLERVLPGRYALRPLSDPVRTFPLLTLLGILTLILPVAYPYYFFSLVWVWAFLLLEPINYLLAREDSLLYDLEQGSFRRPFLLLLAGMLCGLFWESWNYWAGTKWVYTLPWAWLMRVKLFEMPLPGYLGFPPFALECWSMWTFARIFRRYYRSILVIIFPVLFSLWIFHQIDKHTVLSFIP